MSPKMPRALWTQLKDRASSPVPFWKGSHVQTWDSSVPVFCWKKGKFLQFGNKRWVIPCPEKNRGLHLGDWHKPWVLGWSGAKGCSEKREVSLSPLPCGLQRQCWGEARWDWHWRRSWGGCGSLGSAFVYIRWEK